MSSWRLGGRLCAPLSCLDAVLALRLQPWCWHCTGVLIRKAEYFDSAHPRVQATPLAGGAPLGQVVLQQRSLPTDGYWCVSRPYNCSHVTGSHFMLTCLVHMRGHGDTNCKLCCA